LSPDVTFDELFTVYDQTLRNIADSLAPEHVVQSQVRRQCPWFDADCRDASRHCSRLESRYRRTRQPTDRDAYVQSTRSKHELLPLKKQQHWTDRITAFAANPRKLWQSMTSVMQQDTQPADSLTPSTREPDDFRQFFEDKVNTVRASTEHASLSASVPTATGLLLELVPCTEEEVRQLITMAPT